MFLLRTFKALNGLLCADVPLRNYSLTELGTTACCGKPSCRNFCHQGSEM